MEAYASSGASLILADPSLFASRALVAKPSFPPPPSGAGFRQPSSQAKDLLDAALAAAEGSRRAAVRGKPTREEAYVREAREASLRHMRQSRSVQPSTARQRQLPGRESALVAHAAAGKAPRGRTSRATIARQAPGRPGTGSSSDYACSDVSHATTPSWRSRSFPPHYRGAAASECGSQSIPEDDVVVLGAQEKLARRELPPLPLEARWMAAGRRNLAAPSSEMQRLNKIDPAVDEANAQLVESFLNVKRSLAACSEASAAFSEVYVPPPSSRGRRPASADLSQHSRDFGEAPILSLLSAR